MSRGKRALALCAILLPQLVLAFSRVTGWRRVLPLWAPMMAQLALVVAACVVAAAMVFGIKAWREAAHA